MPNVLESLGSVLAGFLDQDFVAARVFVQEGGDVVYYRSTSTSIPCRVSYIRYGA